MSFSMMTLPTIQPIPSGYFHADHLCIHAGDFAGRVQDGRGVVSRVTRSDSPTFRDVVAGPSAAGLVIKLRVADLAR
jgi:hypothetical protein